MTTRLGPIPHTELAVLVAAAAGCDLPEEDGTGLLVTCIDGHRVWQFSDDDVLMTVFGDPAEFPGTWHVPVRLVASMRQITAPGDSCELNVDGDHAVGTNSDDLSLRMRLHPRGPEYVPIAIPTGVSATVPYSVLEDMASLVGHEPWQVDDRDRMVELPPVGEVRIGDSELTFFRGWAYMGGIDTTVTVGARTTGHGSLVVGHLTLQRMLCGYWMDDIDDVTVSLDPEGRYLVATCSRFHLRLGEQASGAASFYPRLRLQLLSNEIEHVTDTSGAIAARYEDVPVRLQLLDGESPVLRITVTALHAIPATPELLTELNAMNTTRVLNRVWADNNMVVVGTDLRSTDLDSLVPTMKSLVREARNLGGVLGPLFGGQAPRA